MPSRLLKPLVFLLSLVFMVTVFAGCRIIGGGSDNSPTAGPSISGRITRIVGQPASVRTDIKAAAGTETPVPGARVWLESDDGSLYAGYGTTDANGNFVLTNVPGGTYHIIARYSDAGGDYISRSPGTVEGNGSLNLEILPGTNKVAGYLRGPNGQPLPRGTTLVLWGQPFTVESDDGYFSSPTLPEGISSATLLISGTTTYPALALLAPFISGNQPIILDITLPGPTESNHPPSVLVFPTINNVVSNKPTGGETVIFKASGKDIDAGEEDALTYLWAVADNLGTIQSGQGTKEITWIAPDAGGVATVTLTVTDPRGATGVARVSLTMPGRSYTLTINTLNGTVTKNPNAATYVHGTQVGLTGVGNPGYVLSGWFGDIAAGQTWTNPLSLSVTGNASVFGTFAKRFAGNRNGQYWWIGDDGKVSLQGPLALDANIRALAPVAPVVPGDSRYVAWDSYKYTACGVKSDGSLFLTGAPATSGEPNNTDFSVNLPTDKTYVDVSIGQCNAFALKNDGTIQPWGTVTDKGAIAGPPAANNANIVSIARHGAPIAIKRDGSLVMWNSGYFPTTMTLPQEADGTGFIDVAGQFVGNGDFAALKADGTLVIWIFAAAAPVGVFPNTGLVSIGMGWGGVTGVKSDGTLALYQFDGMTNAWKLNDLASVQLTNQLGGAKALAVDVNGRVTSVLLENGTVKVMSMLD